MPQSSNQQARSLPKGSIAIDPVTVVIKECLLISSSMRKISKYSQSGVAAILGSGAGDLFNDEGESNKYGLNSHANGSNHNTTNDPLLSGFIQLRLMLNNSKNLDDIDSLTLLQPFLLVIKSSSTTGNITSLALDSLSKFISYNIISASSKNLAFTLTHIISSLTHCRFEASEQSSDDAVLLKVLNLLETIIDSSLGDLLSDDVIYEVVQTSLSLACNKRRSEVLRKAAELSMYTVTIKVFKRLDSIEPEQHHHIVEETQDYTKNQLVGTIGTNDDVTLSKKSFEVLNDTTKPFGLPAIKQFLGILISMIAPENQFKHTESTKVFAFSLIATAVEMSADRFSSFPSLLNLIADPVFKHTLHIIQNINSLPVLQAALQLFTTLSLTLGDHLQAQIELSLITIFNAILPQEDTKKKPPASGKSTPIELNQKSLSAKELLVEEISILWTRSPSFFMNLFINYDCNFHRTDLTVRFIKFLSELSLPESASFTTDNVPPICLEGLISFVNKLSEQIKTVDPISEQTTHELLIKKEKKKEFIAATKIFNQKPKDGLKALEDKGFIKSSTDIHELAIFFYEKSSRLNKKVLGEFLAKPSNLELLKEFYSLFDFEGLRVDEALRILLKTFRLPGESQQIERIVENFANRYVKCQNYQPKPEDNVEQEVKSGEVEPRDSIKDSVEIINGEEDEPVEPDADAVFVLSYSIILLNTDLHNPNIKAHMTLDDYKRNLRGVYNKKDFPVWYLEKIYQSIEDKEIVMPEEHHGSSQWFDDSWNNLIAANISIIDDFYSVDSFEVEELIQFEKNLFQSVFEPICNTILKIFEVAFDDQIVTKMMTTVDKLSQIASFFKFYTFIDKLVIKLCDLTTLTGVKSPSVETNNSSPTKVTRIKVEGGDPITVSETSVLFGKDFKAQISTVVLFRILNRDLHVLNESWKSFHKVIFKLFQTGLIEPDFFPQFQSQYKLAKLPRIRPEVSLTRSTVTKGLFSTFASYLKGDDEPTDEEVEATLSAVDCIKSSGVHTFFQNPSALISGDDTVLKAVLETLPTERTVENERTYEADLFFTLENALVLALSSPENTNELNTLLEYIEKVESAENNKKLNASMFLRLTTYKLIIINNSQQVSAESVKKSIDQILEIDRKLLEKKAQQIVQPLCSIGDPNSSTSSIALEYENYWKSLRLIASVSQFSRDIFYFINHLLKTSIGSIKSANFMWLLGLLDEISAVGAIGGQWEQEYDALVKSGHQVDKENPYQDIVQLSLKSINATASLIDIKADLTTDQTYALIQALAHQCLNPCFQIRSYALSSLEDTVLKIELTDGLKASGIFDFGIFPLLNEDIAKNEILSLISKVYLHFFKLGKADNAIFLKILDIYNQFLEDPAIESELQNLITSKKEIEKETGVNVEVGNEKNDPEEEVVETEQAEEKTEGEGEKKEEEKAVQKEPELLNDNEVD